MLCYHCHKSVRNCEGIQCSKCEAKCHLKCVADAKDIEFEGGDRKFHWLCNKCQPNSKRSDSKECQPEAIKEILDKIELINKIQLPKLCNDVLQIKCIIEQLAKQNEDVVLQIGQMTMKKQTETRSVNTLQRRNFRLSPRGKMGNTELIPIVGLENKVRYRARRKPYPILKLLLLINKSIRRNRTAHRRIKK